MRLTAAAAVSCLLLTSLPAAEQAAAAITKQPTNIPAQSLETALEAFAKGRDLQLVYATDDVDHQRTAGAVGNLTATEALREILKGTGLSYRFLDDHTVTVQPGASGNAPTPKSASGDRAGGDGSASIGDRYRLAQAEQGSALALTTHAAEPGSSSSVSEAPGGLNEIIVTGTRITGLKAAESAAPIQIFNAEALRSTGAPDLQSALAQVVPSLQMQAYGGDMSANTLQARLRGLSPNDVLVLVNGKRRHTTANLAVDSGTPYQGGAGVDLNFIPLDAIDHVEVLTDGAAAQYGTDAIAGVINIILKSTSSGGSLAGTFGQYGNNGDGRTEDVSGNIGLAPAGGYFNLTGNFHHHGSSNVAAVDPRLFPSNVATYSYPDTNVVNVAGYPNFVQFGDGEYQQKLAALNSGFNFDNGTQLYLFGSYGHKNASTFEAYRMPSKVQYTDPAGVTTYPLPYGFTPSETSAEDDFQANLGIKGTLATWDYDLATGYGQDHYGMGVTGTYNAGTYALNGIPTPTSYYVGYLKATQWTSTADFKRDFNVGFASPLNVAFGVEHRRETYTIGQGVPLSYEDGGAQSFPGFTPADASSHARTNYAGYLDLSAKPVDPLRVDAAVRYEHYSDFGSAVVGKLTGRFDFSPQFAIRGTVSNGFRAPTLAEEFYSATNVGPSTAFIQLPPNSPAAAVLGLGNGLRPEKSINFSAGLVWRPIPRMSATLDVYQITLTNRIVGTGNIAGQVNGQPTASSAAVNAAIAAYSNGTNLIDPNVLTHGSTGINIFANGIDTRTDGADLMFDFPAELSFGRVNWSIGATYNNTSITNPGRTPAQLAGNVLYNIQAYSDLTTATPRYVVNLGALLTMEKLSVNLVEKIYGPSSDYENDDGDNPSFNFEFFKDTIGVTAITNLDVGYQFTDHLELSAGAINLFNRFPNKVNATILGRENAYVDVTATVQYPVFSPFGINGGFYYVKAAYRF